MRTLPYTKKTLSVGLVILLGIIIGVVILIPDRTPTESGDHSHEDETTNADYPKGLHGGRLLSANDFSIEITIYETGVPPVFRVYAYSSGTPIDPTEVTLSAEVHRLGGVVDKIAFVKEKDYLLGDKVIYEPHSFDVKLTAQYNGGSHNWMYSQLEGRTELSPSAVTASGIVIDTVGPATIQASLDLPGEIVSNADRVAHVVPRLAGVVTEIRKSIGDHVGKGEVIAVVQSRELADLGAAYLAASKRVGLAQATLAREESLFQKKISAEQDYQLAQQALAEAQIDQQTAEQKLRALGVSPGSMGRSGGASMTRYEILAPFNGTVLERRVSLGESLREDSDIFLLADLSTVWVDITVYANDVRSVKNGQKVSVRSEALGTEATGTISYLSSIVDSQTRSAKARILLENPQGLWRPGVSVNVRLVQEEINVPVAVRTTAVQKFRDWDVVFIQDGNRYEARPIELGRSDGQWIEVLSGIAPGSRYVAENSFIVKADIEKSGASHDH